VQIGYNFQPSCHTLWGIEADWSWGSLDATSRFLANIPGVDFRITTSLNSYGTIRTRSGLVLDNLLLYVTGGLAFADMDTRVLYRQPGIDFVNGSSSDMRWGWTAGVGTEWAVATNVSVKSEILYMNFGDNNTTYPLVGVGPPTASQKTNDSMWVSRLGVNIKFGCGGRGSWC